MPGKKTAEATQQVLQCGPIDIVHATVKWLAADESMANFAVTVSPGITLVSSKHEAGVIYWRHIGRNFSLIQRTVGSVRPVSLAGPLRYNAGRGEQNAPLTDLFPGGLSGDFQVLLA